MGRWAGWSSLCAGSRRRPGPDDAEASGSALPRSVGPRLGWGTVAAVAALLVMSPVDGRPSQLFMAGPASTSGCDANGLGISYRSEYTSPVGYTITSLTVSGLDTSGCAGRTFRILLRDDNGEILSHGSVIVASAGTSAEVEVAPRTLVSEVTNADVALGR